MLLEEDPCLPTAIWIAWKTQDDKYVMGMKAMVGNHQTPHDHPDYYAFQNEIQGGAKGADGKA